MNSDWAALLDLLLAPLSDEDGWQVRRAFVQALETLLLDSGSLPYAPEQLRWARADALMAALTAHAEDQAIPAWWLVLQVDWKAADEVEWQAQLIAKTQGLTKPYEWQANPGDGVPEGLAAFAAWLEPQGFCYRPWLRDEDAYAGFVVPHALAEAVEVVALRVGLDG
ncbi:hypothetical protein E7T06_06455 [Deinococcus sp. Arct2-2]|uniref:DUF6630 family protein n=1 Tax=Deinococcus sp. Arct2-2 TaxID=2568653 RepID=UPI0010A2D388|nr:hypothetical protein [Deinococcus sp. Arct2-2]THF70568.1 hypothetical protein E7T06_06455 [Deinococcus sp. Arct2-2]